MTWMTWIGAANSVGSWACGLFWHVAARLQQMSGLRTRHSFDTIEANLLKPVVSLLKPCIVTSPTLCKNWPVTATATNTASQTFYSHFIWTL
jgi:hypothetical protein